MKIRNRHLQILVLTLLLHAAPVAAQPQAVMIRPGLTVLPVFFVPSGEAPPTALQQTTLMRHLYWAQQRYYDMLGGRGTFAIASDRPEIYGASSPASFYMQQSEGAAPNFVDELLRSKNLTRFNCPYVFLVIFMSAAGDFPNPAGGRPINGWMNEGGGVIIFSSSDLSAFDFQSTLRHELGHSFDLVHVDSYGYDMASNASIMAYNTDQWTNFFYDSIAPGILIPEDIRALAQNKLAFPLLQFTSADVPPGYTIYPLIVVLPPMDLPNQPAYTAWDQYFSTDTVTQTVKVGEPAVFVASAHGFQPSTYQWQLNGAAISGATAAALVIANARQADAGYYTVQVKGASGTPVSNMGILNVTAQVTPSSAALSPTSAYFGSPGGEGTVSLTIAPANANWSASSNVDWLTVPSGNAGTGNWTLVYSVAPNPSAAARTGQIMFAGATFSVNQAGSGAGASTSITINNPGFETLPPNPKWLDCSGYAGPGCRYTADGNVPGWTASGVGENGLLQMGPKNLFTLPMPAAEGQTVAQINSGTLSQTLNATLQASTTYKLQVDVGRRLDNLYSTPPTARLFAGSNLIASATGAGPLLGGWTTWTGTYQSGTSDPLAGQVLKIVLSATAPQGNFDNVRLTTVLGGTAPPMPTVGGIANGASFSGTQAPAAGSITSLFGTNLAAQTLAAATVPLSTTLGGGSVLVNGVAAPLFFVSAGQINFQIPWEVAGQAKVSVAVKFNNVAGEAVTLPLASAGPGLFTINSSGTGQGAIQIANTAIFSAPTGSIPGAAARPAQRSEFITIYCTGLGAVLNPPASGAAGSGQTTSANPTMTIGGVPVTPSFSGLAPGYVGLYQVNAQVPSGVTPGNTVPVVITMNGSASNTVTMAVQ